MSGNGVGGDLFFLLVGGILVFAMHGGFAFLEAGTVRRKNQVNALVKILVDFAISTTAYFVIGYYVAYRVGFFEGAATLVGGDGFGPQGIVLVRFFFLATFAAAVPAIISGGIAERMRFLPQCAATAVIVAVIYPLFEGFAWGGQYGIQSWFAATFGAAFHDFAGSVVVHAIGGWLALGAVLRLGPRLGRYRTDGSGNTWPPSSIPWLALGSWLLCIGWFGFNVMSAQSLGAASGLVAINSLMAMVGGILVAVVVGRNDPGFVHNGALAGLVAVCAGSDVMHPVGALIVGGVAGALFVKGFEICQFRLKVDDVLGVWPLHGVCGLWGGLACGIFGLQALGGMGGVSFAAQLVGSLGGALYALAAGLAVYSLVDLALHLRLSPEEERRGADLSIHKVGAYPESDIIG
jgi:Amt family ammonium transporter